jgi:5-carboxymethyl-2-hydroxymuconate isomerase
MPHLIIEYSGNVAGVADIDGLVDAVHSAALATGIAPLDALRTRAAAREHYAIGDRHPDNMFVALTARLGAGRSDDDKAAFLRALMDALTDHLGAATANMMLSVEYQEIDPAWRINENHLRAVIAERTGPSPTGPSRTGPSRTGTA